MKESSKESSPRGWAASRWGEARTDGGISSLLAVLSLLSVLPGLVGILFGVPWLVQPLDTFAPARLGGAVLIPLAAAGMLAKVGQRRMLARGLALISGALSLAVLSLAISGVPSPIDGFAADRLGDEYARQTASLPATVSFLFLLYSAALSLLTARKQTEHTLLIVGGLASSQVALAGVLFTTQLAGLVDGTAVQPLRAPLSSLLAALALGFALLERLARREQMGVAPPRWAPVLAGVSSTLVVVVLWQALLAREASQVQARSVITVEALDRAVQRQFQAVQNAMGRSAAFLSASRELDDPLWSTGLPRLVEETPELKHVLWLDSTGTLLRTASRQSVPPDVLAAIQSHVRASKVRRATMFEPHSTGMDVGPWRLALWLPVLSPVNGPTVLVALIDDVQLVRLFADDASREFALRISVADSVLLQLGTASTTAAHYTAPLSIGARRLMVDMAQRPGIPRSPLPDVVLALGLTVSFLLALTLWLQRRNWLQAHEEGRRFRALFDTAFQVQLLLDASGTVLEANRAAGELAESDPEQLNGIAFWRAPWWADDQVTGDRVRERFEKALAGETQRFEVEVGRTRTRALTVDFSLKPVIDASQRIAQVIAEGRDLTIRKRAEESMREMSALTTMGRLAARVAHEINNPLAGIQNSFLLIRGAIPTDHPHYRFVGAIEREISRIAAVTRQLYETYRPDQSTVAESSVILAVSDAVSFLEQVNRGRQIRIVAKMAQAPSMVPVPDALLRQTLYNLVQNAMDVSPPDGTVTVSAVQEGDECVLRVADEGPGIPMAIRERIFDPFFSTKDRTMKTGGMGIGLALVRQSVLAVGGRIDVRDRPTGGTEFEVRLPMTPLDTGVLR